MIILFSTTLPRSSTTCYSRRLVVVQHRKRQVQMPQRVLLQEWEISLLVLQLHRREDVGPAPDGGMHS